MKLQIKTIEQKSLMVDIEETKTVYDLKKKLSLYADVGVEPELQKLIYNGTILNNNVPLSTYNIDVKKYLIIMILRQPSEEPHSMNVSSNTSPADASKIKSADNGISSAEQGSDIDDMIIKLTSMGFSEMEIRRALNACSNNPNHAIDYLIANTPLPRYRLVIKQVIDVHAPRDEALINTRQAVFQNPALNAPPNLNIVNNREDNLAMLLENMSNGGADDDDEAEN